MLFELEDQIEIEKSKHQTLLNNFQPLSDEISILTSRIEFLKLTNEGS
jgi:hypothetical protein